MNESLKIELIDHLKGGMAFMPVSKLLDEITFDELGNRPRNLPYSFYELFYHIYFTQKDILNFLESKDYSEPNWPDSYWPSERCPSDEKTWEDLKKAYLDDRKKLGDSIEREEHELDAPVANATKPEQTHLREILLIIEHTAYHTGQLLVVLRLLKLHN